MQPRGTAEVQTREREPARLLDVAVGASALALTAGGAVARAAETLAGPVVGLVLRPPGIPRGLQPRTWLGALARQGGVRRELATQRMASALDQAVPAVVTQVADRLDTTALVNRYVDVEAIVADVDLVRLVKEVVAELDVAEIIRESSGAMASESVRELRMQSISGDDAVGRAVARLRRRRTGAKARVPVDGSSPNGAHP